MAMLSVKASVLHRRKLVDCTPGSSVRLMWGVNDSLPPSLTKDRPGKTPRVPNVSRNLTFRNSSSISPQSVQNFRAMVYSDNFKPLRYESSSDTSVEKSSKASGSGASQQQVPEGNGNSRTEGLDQINTAILGPEFQDRCLEVKGQKLYQSSIPRTVDINWHQSIKAIRCVNDPMRMANISSAAVAENTLQMPSNIKQSRSNSIKVLPVFKETEPNRCKPKQLCGRANYYITESRLEKKSYLGRGLLNLEINPEKDKIVIDDLRRMLRYSTSRPINSEKSLNSEKCGQYKFRPQKDHLHSAVSRVGCEANNYEVVDTESRKDSLASETEDSPDESTSFSNDHNAFDHRAKIMTETPDDRLTTKQSKFWVNAHINSSALPPTADSSNDVNMGVTNMCGENRPYGSWVNRLPVDTGMQRSKHHALELIDKIKDTQRWLAGVRVKSQHLLRPNSEESSEREVQSGDFGPTRAHDSKWANRSKKVRHFCRTRLEALRLPFTRATVSSLRRSRPPCSIKEKPDHGAGGDGDFSVQGPSPSFIKCAAPSNLKEDILASLDSITEKPDPKTHILSWLENVQPLIKKQESLKAK